MIGRFITNVKSVVAACFSTVLREYSRFVFRLFCFVSFVLTTSCHGVYGIASASSEVATGGTLTHVNSYGFEVRSVAGYKGITIGSRSTSYFMADISPENDEKSWGVILFPNKKPIYTQSAVRGMEIAWEPSFCGFSCGFDYRSCIALKADESAVMQIYTTANKSAEKFRYINE